MKVPDDNEEWWLASEEDGDASDHGVSRMSNGGQLAALTANNNERN